MRELVRQHKRFFLLATLGAFCLRLLFLLRFPGVVTDSFVYGDIAKNWLQHGIYGLSGPDAISPTYIRLPGYPMFLAAVFAVFGMEHYRAVLIIQIFIDIFSCFLIADIARRMIGVSAAKTAFLLAALCPFLADYSAAALTETLEIFFTTLAVDLVLVGLGNGTTKDSDDRIWPWVGCGLAVAAAMLLRPDGGILLAAVVGYLGWTALQCLRRGQSFLRPIRNAVIVGFLAVAPFVPWTIRNLHTFHKFQPLAPRYANNEDEFVPMGFNRWIKTWMIDYASVEEVYWSVPGDQIDFEKLPNRAFDSAEQREQTQQAIADYNDSLHMTPDLDARFDAIASARRHAAPLRYYVWLPLARMADMWVRPRTEKLPSDSRWWEFNDDGRWSTLAIVLGAINLFYVGAALAGLIRGRFSAHLGFLLFFVILRSAFLSTLENPEPRYTLECYPVVIVLASALLKRRDAQSK